MLVAMLTLNKQLSDAAIKEDEVQFNIEESETGTQYIFMMLSEQQQQQISESLANS